MKSPEQFCERVAYWQSALADLGIAHWQIDVEFVEDSPHGDEGADASVWCSNDYDLARLHVTTPWLAQADDKDFDSTIVHELLHISMRDYDAAIEMVEGALSPSVCELWEAQVTHEREGVVDRLARTILLLHGEGGTLP